MSKVQPKSPKSLAVKPLPTYGELIDLFSFIEEEHGSNEAMLCAKFKELYPHIEVGRPHRFFDTVQRIVAPSRPSIVSKPPLSGTPLSSYRRRVWKPRIRNPPKGPSLVFPQELLSYGLSEEVLTASFQQVCAGEPVGWKLTCIPTIGFYKALHRFLKQWPLSSKVTKCKIAEFYMAIDAKLKAKGGRPDNIYRFIENLTKAKASSKLMCYETPEQKIRRLKSNIGHCNKQLEEVTSEYMELKGQFQESKCKLQGTQKVLQDVTNQRDTLKRSKDFLKTKLSKCEGNYESLQEEYALVYMENVDLAGTVADCEAEGLQPLSSKCVKQGQAYPPALRKLYYSLLTKQIPAAKVADIVKTVLKTFHPSLDVERLSLPQKACASYMRKDELVTVCSAQKATLLCEAAASASGFHLNTDGTTKNQKKIGSVVVNDIVVSVNELCDGTAATAIDDISRELEKLRTTARSLGIPNANSINWTLLVSSTSDSASTQKRLNKLIQECREADAEKFGHATSDTMELIENFCSMHLGVNLRKAFLTGIDNEDTSATTRRYNCVDTLVHEFCKLFGAHGVPEYACGGQSFPDFLELMSHGCEYFHSCTTITLDRQVGSRYFVSASNAVKILHLKDAAIQFLSFTNKNESGNKLEREVYTKLHDLHELAALRADGLVYYHVYADLVMLSKSKVLSKSAFDMNTHYLELKLFLNEAKDNIEIFLNKSGRVFVSEERLYGSDRKTNHRLHGSMCTLTDSLFTIPEHEISTVKWMLTSGILSMTEKLCSYAKNQLPGGIYWNPDEPIKIALSQLKPSNDICESVLGLNDYLTTALPNLHQASRSNLVQMKKNKTLQWLGTLPLEQQEQVVGLAVKNRTKVSEMCKQEMTARAMKRQQNLIQEHTRREALRRKQVAEKEELCNQHLIASREELLSTIAEIDNKDITLSRKKTEKLSLLKMQIKIRKKILKQNISIVFSRSRRQRPLTEVIDELSIFISENTPFGDILQHPESIVGSQVNHLFFIDGQTKWYSGTIVNYNTSRKTHELVYDGEEEHCFFDLSIDIVNGDLEIVG